MRKRLSVAALGLRMTWGTAVLCILAATAVQLWVFSNQQMGEDPLAEMMIDAAAGPAGWCKYAMMLTMVLTMARAKSRYDYTLNRLRIGEGECLAIWSVVFSGYFLLAWGAHLASGLVMLGVFARERAMDSMDLFLAVTRSWYLHTLLPHGEPWAYARNAAICLCYGTVTAHFSWLLRNRKTWIGVVSLVGLAMFGLRSMGTGDGDVVWCLAFPALVLALFLARKWVASDED